MQIAYHIGANNTDGDKLLKSLIRNADSFSKQGVKVPGPGKYRRLIRETIQNLAGANPAPSTREVLLDAILDDEEASRVVLSHHAFICVPNRIFEGGEFYALVQMKVASLVRLFPEDELELFFALRNPATFIPDAYSESRYNSLSHFMQGLDPRLVKWSDVVRAIRQSAPNARLTVWCNEDTPLIWAQLIREVAGLDPLAKIEGGYDLLSSIMRPEGMKRFLTYLKSHPPQTEIQKRRIIAAFLDKYALEDEIEEEIDAPGWTDELVAELTELYEDDVFEIERMPGINFIAP